MLLLLCGALSWACSDREASEVGREPRAWPTGDLVDVAVLDDQHVIVVAKSGEIHVSADAGRSWRPARVPAVPALRSLSMADARHGWVVGEGVILRTDEGGASWRRQRLPRRAAEIHLIAVSAIDRENAIAVGEAGIELHTRDAGRLWVDRSFVGGRGDRAPSGVYDVFCIRDRPRRCWAAGTKIRVSDDPGANWRTLEVEDSLSLEPLVFGFGEVEISGSDRDRLLEFVDARRGRSVSFWRIEPRIGRDEIERIGRRRDPEALFDLIAARILETRSQLEEAGIPEDRIRVRGNPPWDYEDSLDDDPDLLERYWHERSATTSEIVVRAIETAVLRAIRIDARGLGLAVGEGGVLVRSRDRGRHWRMARRISPHDLFAVDFGRSGAVAVGAQGGIWLSPGDGEAWRRPGLAAGTPAFFDALRALSFSPSGELGIIVGDHGLLLQSLDGGTVWRRLEVDLP